MPVYGRFFSGLLVVPVILFALVFTGCDRRPRGLEPAKIVSITPETQIGGTGETLVKNVRVELLSNVIPGMLGGKGEPHSLAGFRLMAAPVDAESGLKATPSEGVTDAGGNFEFSVTLGNRFGDQYLDVFCADAPEIRKRLRFVAGAVIENDRQEVAAGDALAKPFRVRLTGPDQKPLTDVPVYFTLSRQPGKAGRLSKNMALTDSGGVAEVGLKTDSRATGNYEINVEVADPVRGLFARPFYGEAVALCPIGVIIVVLGGLAIFIFGMTLMSDGLQQVAGSKMKAALAYITRNRVTAIMAGTFVTALVQSSSATTVMTVGFVNAGLLTLRQAIGVIFGANIGTTVTGQMISFKLDALALPATIIGVSLLILARKDTLQGIARSILGIGLLFFGMTMMSDELTKVSAFPSFVRFFHTFDCTPASAGANMPITSVLGAVGIGTALTCLVQSSAATIGLTIALANSGLLSIWTAIPIVLGDNIGTTITAILAALNANRTARQTAMAHSMFNILGTVVMILLFYCHIDGIPCFLFLVNNVTSGNVLLGENIGRHVAMSHTLFNVMNVFLMTPFIGTLAWICEHILPGKKVTTRTVHLEMNLLNTPPLALFCAMRALGDMTETAWNAAAMALRGYKDGAPADINAIQKIEDQVDERQEAIMDYLVQLARKEISEQQAAAIPVLMHCVNDAERISDLALLVAKRSASQASVSTQLSETAHKELDVLMEKATIIADLTRESLQDGRLLAKAVEVVVKDLEGVAQKSMESHVDRLQKGRCTPERGLVYVEVIGAIENIVRHLENIAQRSDLLTEAAS